MLAWLDLSVREGSGWEQTGAACAPSVSAFLRRREGGREGGRSISHMLLSGSPSVHASVLTTGKTDRHLIFTGLRYDELISFIHTSIS